MAKNNNSGLKQSFFVEFTQKLSIRPRLIAAFFLVGFLGIGLSINAINSLGIVSQTTVDLYNRPFKVTNIVMDMERDLVTIEKDMLRAVVAPTMEETKKWLDEANELGEGFEAMGEELAPIFAKDAKPERREKLEEFFKQDKEADVHRQEVDAAALALNNDLAMKILNEEYMEHYQACQKLLLEIEDIAMVNAENFYNESIDKADNAEKLTLALGTGQIILTFILALIIVRSIIYPLLNVKRAAQQVAQGNLDVRVDYNQKDEIGDVARAFTEVIDALTILSENTETLKECATKGDITKRVEADKISGKYKEIIGGINGILDIFVGHFNAIPLAVTISDTGNNVLFENKTVQSYRQIDPSNIDKQTSAFCNEVGQAMGNLEIGIDQTEVKTSQRESQRQAAAVAAQMVVAEKQSKFQQTAVQMLIESLEKLAVGDLNIVAPPGRNQVDEDIREVYENFQKIGITLESSCSTIKSYISELSDILGKIADKDLNIGIDREYLGDFTALKTSINNIAENLNDVFGEILSATNQVQTGSSQMASASQTLSQGASEQASAIEQISSTVAIVAEQTKSNADNANRANSISLSAKKDAEVGNRQMGEMVVAMGDIKEASQGIANIIKVIEDIAFQTNILALNAAVEAARAGEHGKGFAVVAEEVRNLAARSATAAKETTDMIENSINRVEIGSKIANETAGALNKIVSGVTATVDIVETIAEASAQQASAIAQIDNGIEQVSKVTQDNTAAAEETASASEEMAGQAHTLYNMVSNFKLKNS